jgi:hypothetical protein
MEVAMSKGIPRVREYLIKTTNGQTFRVLAPTRQLALLNLRHDSGVWFWGPIKSVAAARKPVGQRVSVVEETIRERSKVRMPRVES